MRKIVYSTRLSVAECQQRLQSHVIPSSGVLRRAFVPMDEGTIVAKVRGDRFRLFAKGPRYVQNSFAPFLYGKMETAKGGSRIIGRFRMHPFVRAFMSVWFGGLAVIAIVAPIIGHAEDAEAGKPPFIFLFTPLLMILFGIGLVALGRLASRGQVSRLLEFLCVDLEATPEGDAGANGPARGSQLFRSETNRTSSAAGSRRSP